MLQKEMDYCCPTPLSISVTSQCNSAKLSNVLVSSISVGTFKVEIHTGYRHIHDHCRTRFPDVRIHGNNLTGVPKQKRYVPELAVSDGYTFLPYQSRPS